MRRIDWLRVVVSDEQVSCSAVGVSDRLPVERPITLAAATRLAADGIPTVVRRRPSPEDRLSPEEV